MKKQLSDKELYKVVIYTTQETITEYVENDDEIEDVVACYKFFEKYPDYDTLVDNNEYLELTDFIKYEIDRTPIKLKDIKNYKLFKSPIDWRNFVKKYDKDGSKFPSIENMYKDETEEQKQARFDKWDAEELERWREKRLNNNYNFLRLTQDDTSTRNFRLF
jgi:hypothetical protein